jgi:hypothetical protein
VPAVVQLALGHHHVGVGARRHEGHVAHHVHDGVGGHERRRHAAHRFHLHLATAGACLVGPHPESTLLHG